MSDFLLCVALHISFFSTPSVSFALFQSMNFVHSHYCQILTGAARCTEEEGIDVILLLAVQPEKCIKCIKHASSPTHLDYRVLIGHVCCLVVCCSALLKTWCNACLLSPWVSPVCLPPPPPTQRGSPNFTQAHFQSLFTAVTGFLCCLLYARHPSSPPPPPPPKSPPPPPPPPFSLALPPIALKCYSRMRLLSTCRHWRRRCWPSTPPRCPTSTRLSRSCGRRRTATRTSTTSR